jgi:HlyD family secretion protein
MTRVAVPDAPDAALVRTLGLHRRKRSPWIKRITLTVVAVGLVAGGVSWWRSGSTAPPVEYVTSAVTVGDVRVTVSATGTVEALNTVEVGAEVSGRVTKLYVDYNDPVKEGQLLAEIDPEQQQASLDEANARVTASSASIRQAEATLEEAEANLARAQSQQALGLVSAKDVEAAKASAARARASLASARSEAVVTSASLKSSRSKLGKTQIVSPINGVVLSRSVENGQTVTAGFTTPVLFKLAEDLRRMSLHVYVDEADVGRVKEGQLATFTVDAFPTKTFPAELVSLRNEPKTESNVVSYEAVLSISNDELLLRPGMTATASIICDEVTDVMVVPNAALRFTPPQAKSGGGLKMPGPPGGGQPAKPAGPTLWLLDGPTPRSLLVTTGVTDGTLTEVSGEGLTVGTKVVTDTVEKAVK